MNPSGRYIAAPGAQYDDEAAAVIGAEIERLARTGQDITPALVVEAATKPTSPLHKFFEWNNDVAAARYREQQARHLVNHLQVVVQRDGVDTTMKAQFSVVVRHEDDTTTRPQYVSVRRIQDEEDLREQVRDRGLKELKSWAARYRALGFEEFESVYAVIDTLAVSAATEPDTASTALSLVNVG